MYAYIKGKDNYFCFNQLRTRKEAEEWCDNQITLYHIYYKDNPITEILSNREFFDLFEEEYHKHSSWRRIGTKLKEYIEEVKSCL